MLSHNSAWLNESDRYSIDSFHLSASGHKEAAMRIKEIVDSLGGVVANPRVNDFDVQDDCQNWFLSGDTGDTMKISHNGAVHPLSLVPTNNNKKIVTNNKNTKFVLTFDGDKGFITLNNSSNQTQALFISYMTTGPPPTPYPLTSVQVADTNIEILLDPNAPGDWQGRYVHLPREQYIGEIGPGEVTLFFQSLEREKKYPFSLVSYMLTPQKDCIGDMCDAHVVHNIDEYSSC